MSAPKRHTSAGTDCRAPLLAVRDLQKTFEIGLPDSRPALNGLSLDLAAGDFVALIGSNGAGKTTLLNAIAGVIAIDHGSIEIDGRDITRMAPHRRAAFIARVFQDPLLGTAATMTIEENLALAERRGKSHRWRPHLNARRRAVYRDLLAALRLGLENRLSAKVAQLSGGQRQALSLVMAVVSEPRLLLLDEHTAALDPNTAALVMQTTADTIAERGLTALMVTHNMQQAIEHGNRLVMLEAGRPVFEVSAPDKARLTAQDLVRRFQINDDRLLLQRHAASRRAAP